MNLQEKNIIVYEDGEMELKVSVNQETIWLTQKQIAELFEFTKQNISLHPIEIFKSKELDKSSTVKKYLTVQKEGNRKVTRKLEATYTKECNIPKRDLFCMPGNVPVMTTEGLFFLRVQILLITIRFNI